MASQPQIDHSDLTKAARDIHREYGGPGIMLKMADEIQRLRGLLQAIELATATGDGLSPDETINVHALAAQHSESGEP